MKIAAYIRVSTDEQADKGNSLHEQKERLTAYCRSQGWTLPTFYLDDGYSAKDTNRPRLQQLISDIEKKDIDIVLTTKLDRLTRKLSDLLGIIDYFDDHECKYVSASESFDTSTAVGRMVLQLLGVFAEFERERTSERVSENMISIAKNSDKAITRPCYGYDIIDRRYAINENESKFVLIMCDLAEAGDGYRMIAKKMNELGSRTKKGKPWDQMNVKRLLKNMTIAGVRVYNQRKNVKGKIVMRPRDEWIISENNHPAIVPLERLRNIHTILESRTVAHSHANNESYLLTGLVKCRYCGGNMKGSTSRHKRKTKTYEYFRYICSSYVLGYGCKHHAVHRNDIESTIVNKIKEIASHADNKLLPAELSTSINYNAKSAIESELEKINIRIQKQIKAYTDELISADDLRAASDAAEAERKRLKTELERIEKQEKNKSAIEDRAAALVDDISGIDRIKAKNSIRQLINKIIVDGKDMSIEWNY